jgi:hypothetical protein
MWARFCLALDPAIRFLGVELEQPGFSIWRRFR